MDTDVMKGQVAEWDAPWDDGTIRRFADISTAKGLSSAEMRLVQCKELLHLLDPPRDRVHDQDRIMDLIESVVQAKTEIQFTKAIEQVKEAIPESLLINGYNPLTLLYRPLSEHVHDKSDTECLELAEAIRLVLVELAEEIGIALNERAELKKAVSRLLDKKKDN